MSDSHEKGQMTVELAVAFPVLLIVAVIAVNVLLFFSECAAFDNALREAVRVCITSPAYGQGIEQGAACVRSVLEDGFDNPYEQVQVAIESTAGGHMSITGTLEMAPTLFGLGLKSTVFGVELPSLEHSSTLTVDAYKPGVLL